MLSAMPETPESWLVFGDVQPSNANELRRAVPGRVLNVGPAEQAMIGICAGLALEGCRPFAYSIATFALFRPYEMVRVDVCYQNLAVTIVGMGAGVVYSSLGGTHQAIEDVAVAKSLPNMQVIAPCDPQETEEATRWCITNNQGPVYLRIGKAGEASLTSGADVWEFGKLRYLARGEQTCIIGYGPLLRLAAHLANHMAARGPQPSIVSAHTLKPFDLDGASDLLRKYRRLIVIEEHVAHGSLAADLKMLAWENGAACKVFAFGLRDTFIPEFGGQAALLERHGLTLEQIIRTIGD
jgi:transketolase